MKHTEGPWYLNTCTDPKRTRLQVLEASEGCADVIVCDAPAAYQPSHAAWSDLNKRFNLIAAAPDLLEACKRASACLARAINNNAFDNCSAPLIGEKTLAMVIAIINKAEGNNE